MSVHLVLGLICVVVTIGCNALSVNAGDDSVGNSSAVLVPGRAVLPPAVAHVPRVSVHEEDDEVDHVVPRQQVAEATWQRPGQSHDQVPQIVGMADDSPPPRHQQILPCRCWDAFQMRQFGVRWVSSKGVLLGV